MKSLIHWISTALCVVAIFGATAVSAQVRPRELGFEEIVYVKRMQYSSDHYYTDINNGTSPDRFRPENGIFVLNLKTGGDRAVITTADMPGGKGFIGKITLSFDAKKVLFDFRETPNSGFRIWEVGIDGSKLRQLTFPAPDEAEKVKRWGRPWHTDDVHPAYLPDGGIIFSSTRCEHTILCGGSAALVAPLLHRMDGDGGNMQQLTKSPVSEFCPVILDDGRVMYHRWEYIDKGARVCKTIWSMNPDGSHPQELYGTTDDTTMVYMYPQPIPDSPDKIVCVGTCHFPQGGCVGCILLIDLQQGSRLRGPDPDEPGFGLDDKRYAVTNITPGVFTERRTEPGWHFKTADNQFVHDKNGASGHLFTHPFPVDEENFLVSMKTRPGDHYKNVADAYGIYLIDTRGARTLVHRDESLSCWHPTPLKARRTPPVIRKTRDPQLAAQGKAVAIVTNIYDNMPEVEKGEIKWLRINEAIPRYWDTGRRWSPSNSSSSWKAALWPRVQWGVVPVEKDGSAQFTVPADKNIFFQALDENFREIQRERTYVNYRPGEVRSCVGCHGRNNQAAQAITHPPLALKRAPDEPAPQPCDLKENGGDGRAQQVIHYPTDIQPILDKKCADCHSGDKPAADLELTGEITQFYNKSYEQIARRELAGPIIPEFTSFKRGDQGNFNGATLPPKKLGSYNSKLMRLLTESDHPQNKVNNHTKFLTPMELMRITRWVDSNYQFYGSYYGRHHSQWQKADAKNTAYNPTDFRREAEFEEAISDRAPEWHR